jgi:hypothetical protein
VAQFKAGQKVVCINSSGFARPYGEQVPVLGRSYTVRGVVGPCIRLREIVNVPQRYATGTMECLFAATRFRRGK